jgi:hypothetical protein
MPPRVQRDRMPGPRSEMTGTSASPENLDTPRLANYKRAGIPPAKGIQSLVVGYYFSVGCVLPQRSTFEKDVPAIADRG